MGKIEFDENGKIVIPGIERKQRKEKERDWKEQPGIRIRKMQISKKTPLKCKLILELNDKVDSNRINRIYNAVFNNFSSFIDKAEIKKTGDRRYEVEIVSGWKRCSFCESFRNVLGENFKAINQGNCDSFGV